MDKLIGRKKELEYLQKLYLSNSPEFLAVYGRRRVGKTHLVRGFFRNKGPYLEVIGLKNAGMQEQLRIFHSSLVLTFEEFKGSPIPRNWREAFEMLTSKLLQIPKTKKCTVFLDELPWLATPRSRLLQELDHFWNARWSKIQNLNLVVCGSAASWMLDKLISAKGGLHNRLTKVLSLDPFDLYETDNFLKELGCDFTPYNVVEIYLAMGGIPYYLEHVSPGRSPAQIVDDLCFRKDGLLFSEFDHIFPSLFGPAEKHLSIIRQIAKHRYGVSRSDLISRTGIPSGGAIGRPLEELEMAGFITKFVPYGKKVREPYFRVTDEYSNFYLKWIAGFKNRGPKQQRGYWLRASQSPSWSSWSGYAFEGVCQKHADRILDALGISGIQCEIATWRYNPGKRSGRRGAQIDLLVDRKDGIISLIEIKHARSPVVITKEYATKLRKKISIFKEATGTHKSVSMVMVSPFGTNKNKYAREILAADITADDLFAVPREFF